MDDPHKIGASKSLERTISDLMSFMENDVRPAGGRRDAMYELVASVSEWWAKAAFEWAHAECYKQFTDGGKVNKTMTRTWPDAELAPGVTRPLKLAGRM